MAPANFVVRFIMPTEYTHIGEILIIVQLHAPGMEVRR